MIFPFLNLKKRNISLFRNINIHLPILKIIDNRQLIAIKRMITVEVDYLLHYNMLVIPRDFLSTLNKSVLLTRLFVL